MFLIAAAFGASLDNLEIGGPWGSPTAVDATSGWWNPAGFALGQGTRIQLEGAPTFATVTYDRAEPHAGTDVVTLAGLVPFVGVASDLRLRGLGIGAALAVPFARGGEELTPPGPGAYHLMSGMSQGIYFLAGGAYNFRDLVSIGATAGLLQTHWSAEAATDIMPDLKHAILEKDPTQDPGYTDSDLENPDYSAILNIDSLSDVVPTFSVGLQARPMPQLTLGVAYIHGGRVRNVGDAVVSFGCPPQSDTIGRFGSESFGLCDATLNAAASVAYALPSRIHAGVAFKPIEAVRLEALGGRVFWNVYEDFDIAITEVATRNQLANPQAATLVEQNRLWARANTDSFWGGLDVKGYFADRFTAGARVLYDQSAVPDAALSTNNYDADTVMLSGLFAVSFLSHLQLGASITQQFLAERDVSTSSFYMTIDNAPAADRWNYPHANGVYNAKVTRLGVSLMAEF